MGIIVAMSAIVVGGYRGMMRAIAERAGVDALVKALTLCRQYATIDGKDTYFWITGFDTYVICRKAGQVDNKDRVGSRSLDPEERKACGYLPEGNYSAYWITDAYADLGSAQDYTRAVTEGAKGDIVKAMNERRYNGSLIFDFKSGKTARVRYPPWFVTGDGGYWIMGLMGPDKAPDGTYGASPPAGSFRRSTDQEISEYGWMVGPEYQLPKGYVFAESMYTANGQAFVSANADGRFYFRPDGTCSASAQVKIVEIGTTKRPSVVVKTDGTIEPKDNP
jgi:hypothetical protein